ncbi:MAG: hypothetical protein WC764_04375 [Candidatus Paceibacterota bacterium]|jgi:hypothetical protein
MPYDKQYYLQHKERYITKAREWALAHPEQRRQIARNSARRKCGTTKKSLAISTTWLGRKWEKWLASKLNAVDVNADGMGKPYDLLWDGKRIDVKAHNLYRRKKKRGRPVGKVGGWWAFSRGIGECDYYFCLCLINGILEKAFLIPSSKLPKSGTTIGWKSKKYAEYLILSSDQIPFNPTVWNKPEFL